MNELYAISATSKITDIIGVYRALVVHSRFQNGINLIGEEGLIFFGTKKNGELPFGIHFEDKDVFSLVEKDHSKVFIFNKEENLFTSDNYIIQLGRAKIYDSQLKLTPGISIKSMECLNDYFCLNLETGFDIQIKDIISPNNKLIGNISKSFKSFDANKIEELLRRLIGRGKGLTPSGDDLLIGLLWINMIIPILGETFYNTLKDLIINKDLTTDISINYYKAAFGGYFSSPLINLHNSLIKSNKVEIGNSVLDLLKCGQTSGIDTLAGIAVGLRALEGEIEIENSISVGW